MIDSDMRPALFVLPACPFCMKVRLFLLEAGVLDDVDVREATLESEATIRAELARHFDKVSFPTLRLPDGIYLADSDAIIDHFAQSDGVDPTDLSGLCERPACHYQAALFRKCRAQAAARLTQFILILGA